MACDGCCENQDLSTAAPRYRRALAVVIALNLGMGVAEMAGGFFGASQALKADSLDFLGDGAITLLGFLALGRRPGWRSRAALLQGWFLALLGAGVLGGAAYRAFVRGAPEAETMGALGAAGLVANLAAAAVLVPHRDGDANVRAVWLFSRNDALGNMAVIVAGGAVWWTERAWPDVVAAVGIAGLFELSAVEIIRRANAELAAPRGTTAAAEAGR